MLNWFYAMIAVRLVLYHDDPYMYVMIAVRLVFVMIDIRLLYHNCFFFIMIAVRLVLCHG